MSDLRVVYDVTGANLPRLTVPAGVALAGYVTGSGAVPWSAAQLAAHPAAVRIAQAPSLLDDEGAMPDVLDVEAGAAAPGIAASWYRTAKVDFDKAARPGQRWPCVYVSASNLTPLANALVAAGVTSGPRLWVAHWDLPVADAVSMLVDSGGPFPVVGVQLHNAGDHDVSLFRADWLDDVSLPPYPPVVPVSRHVVVVPGNAQVVTEMSTDGGKTWR